MQHKTRLKIIYNKLDNLQNHETTTVYRLERKAKCKSRQKLLQFKSSLTTAPLSYIIERHNYQQELRVNNRYHYLHAEKCHHNQK